MTDATPAERPARVSVAVVFGGVDLVVPREWNVRLDVLPVLGAAEDSRLRERPAHDEVDLVVTGSVVFGGVELTD